MQLTKKLALKLEKEPYFPISKKRAEGAGGFKRRSRQDTASKAKLCANFQKGQVSHRETLENQHRWHSGEGLCLLQMNLSYSGACKVIRQNKCRAVLQDGAFAASVWNVPGGNQSMQRTIFLGA